MFNCKLVYVTCQHHLQSKTTRLDDVNNMVVENEQSLAKRKSSATVAASAAWKVSKKDKKKELGPDCWSDLSPDDSDSDPGFISFFISTLQVQTMRKALHPPIFQTVHPPRSLTIPHSQVRATTLPKSSRRRKKISSESSKPKRKNRNPSQWARNERKQLR